MTQQAELLREFDRIPPKYIEEVIAFIRTVQHKAQQEAAQQTAVNHKVEEPQVKKMAKLGITKKELEEMLKNAETPISDSLTGIFAKVGDITKEQIRESRLSEKYPECFI